MIEPCEEAKRVERRYEEPIDKMYQLIGRLKTERMSQAEFEQYAKEHGYIISTTNIIEQIRAEINGIEEGISSYHNDRPWVFKDEVLQIIDKYMK